MSPTPALCQLTLQCFLEYKMCSFSGAQAMGLLVPSLGRLFHSPIDLTGRKFPLCPFLNFPYYLLLFAPPCTTLNHPSYSSAHILSLLPCRLAVTEPSYACFALLFLLINQPLQVPNLFCSSQISLQFDITSLVIRCNIPNWIVLELYRARLLPAQFLSHNVMTLCICSYKLRLSFLVS